MEEGHVAWHLKAKEDGPRLQPKLMEYPRGELIPLDWDAATKAQQERYDAGQRRQRL